MYQCGIPVYVHWARAVAWQGHNRGNDWVTKVVAQTPRQGGEGLLFVVQKQPDGEGLSPNIMDKNVKRQGSLVLQNLTRQWGFFICTNISTEREVLFTKSLWCRFGILVVQRVLGKAQHCNWENFSKHHKDTFASGSSTTMVARMLMQPNGEC